MTNKKTDSLDACPFTPDSDPPEKTLSTNMLEFIDSFFDGWRNVGVAVTLISILTIYSLFSAVFPLIPVIQTPDSWGMQIESEYHDHFPYKMSDFDVDNPELILDNILLEGDESLIIEDKTILLNGFILVKDHSKLIIRNSTLVIGKTPRPIINPLFDENAKILFTNSSSLVIEDSVILPSWHGYELGFIDNSVISSSNAIFANGTLWFDNSAFFTLDESYLQLLYFDHSVSGSITETEISIIFNENVRRRGRVNPFDQTDGAINIDNSQIGLLTYRILGGSFLVDSTTDGYYKSWNNKHDHHITGISPDITVTESYIDGVSMECFHSNGVVKNQIQSVGLALINSSCQVHDSVLYHAYVSQSDLLVNNSYLEFLYVSPMSDYEFGYITTDELLLSNTTLINSRIKDLISADAIIHYDNVFIDEVKIGSTNNIITGIGEGGITYGDEASSYQLSTYGQMAVNNHYKVMTVSEEHIIPNVPLTLVNGSGAEIWKGETDHQGSAYFNITYCNHYPLYRLFQFISNTNDTWKLSATIGDTTIEKEIRYFETGSPIILKFPEPGLLSKAQFSPLSLVGMCSVILVLALKLLRRG